MNGDKSVNLADAVTSLQVAAGMTPPGVTAIGNISSDGKIGIEEAVYALQTAAGIREPAESSRKTAFAYDYMGRRVRKAVYANNELISETLFVWNGWNIIEEITRQNGTESSRYFVWGLDLSQSLQGAGGIGGLLCVSDATASYHYLYDANGNVGQLVNSATGEIAAHYEYDPFGNLTAKSGPYADANPFRFSTKYLDAETGLYNFGLRDYSAKLGRWNSRDKLEEFGGFNLYVFVSCNPINQIDPLGLIAGTIAGGGAAGFGLGVAAAGSNSRSSAVNEANKQLAKILWDLVNPKPALDTASYYLYNGGIGDAVYDYIHQNEIDGTDETVTTIPYVLTKTKINHLIRLYHGTDLCSALAILNGAPLSVEKAIQLKFSREIGLSKVGFYLTPDMDAAVMFATRRDDAVVLQVDFTNKALFMVISSGSIVQPIPPGKLPKSPGIELIVLPTAFPTFNSLRSSGQITITPYQG